VEQSASPLREITADALFDEAFLGQLGALTLVARRIVSGNQRGERKTMKTGTGIEFADHRPYTHGDDIRNVDWGALARLNQVLVRQYEEDEDLPIHVVCDGSASMTTGAGEKYVQARRIVAALAYIGLANLDRVGVAIASSSHYTSLAATRGRSQIFRVLDFLRDAPCGGGTDIASAARRLLAEAGRPGVSVFVSDFYDIDGAATALGMLRHRKHQVVCIQVLDRREFEPSRLALRGDVTLIDAESGARKMLTISEGLLRRFNAAHEQFCQGLSLRCRSQGIPYFRVDIGDDLPELILRILRSGGVLR